MSVGGIVSRFGMREVGSVQGWPPRIEETEAA
jgi:hypothetical protein